jgi:8-amino-7-oxononanoate synthase
MSLDQRWTDELQELRSQGRYRSLTVPSGLDFSSNDYLGYARRTASAPVANENPLDGTALTSGTASRLLRGNHPVWDEVEGLLARWHGAEAALMMTSGYTANEGLLSTVVAADDWVATDQFNHASIIDGIRLCRPMLFIFQHNDLNHLEDGLRKAIRAGTGERFIVTESLNSMEGDRAPLLEMASLAERFGAHLIVDEAHATGCFGPQGSGLVDELGLRSRVLASIHTGGKALGVHGAYICGNLLLKQYLMNRCRHLIFSTALPPALGHWWRTAIPRVQQDETGRESLRRNVALFRDELARLAIDADGMDQIVPLILGGNERARQAALRLQVQGYDIRPIRPPTVPANSARLRISIHADHDRTTLLQLAEALRETLNS